MYLLTYCLNGVHVLTADIHDEYARWSASRSNGRTIHRDGPSLTTVLLGYSSGRV